MFIIFHINRERLEGIKR